ncbi:MAG TPA: hypothetical protein VEX43_11930 [Chthoniobacterales bacterium]|nr:hypothetical protein [Chthoniobacterales bacterium]
MIGFLARGPLKNWELPDEGIPKVLERVLGFLGAIFVVGGWFIATPKTVGWMLIAAIIFLLAAAVFCVRYVLLIPRYKFEKEIANPDQATVRKVSVLGGDKLSPLAKKAQKENNWTEQEILAASAFDPDKVWLRSDRIRVMQRLAICFIVALTLSAGGISWLAYVVQVRLTDKPAAEIIRQEDAPGLKDVKIPDKPNSD